MHIKADRAGDLSGNVIKRRRAVIGNIIASPRERVILAGNMPYHVRHHDVGEEHAPSGEIARLGEREEEASDERLCERLCGCHSGGW